MALLQRRLAARRLAQQRAAAQAALQAALPALRLAPGHELAAKFNSARAAWQRAQARAGAHPAADDAAPPADLLPLLAAAAARAERAGCPAFSGPVLAAAWTLHARAALALPREADRHQALALAAVAAAAAGRPCHLLAASDDDSNQAAQAMRPVFDACGVSNARVAADTAVADLLPAYRADVVHTTARRLAGDLAHDRRLAKTGAPAGATLTRGLHTALLDDLDRVLVDDATAPIVMSIADDATQLGAAIVVARELSDRWPAGADLEGDDGLQRLAALAERLPPFWRGAERRESLLRQALFVRDRLVPGQDFDLAANGQLMLDDTLYERVPDRDLLSGITQALQARLGLPLSPLARTVDRVSMQAFCAGFRHLAGVAPCLDGLAGELWQAQRLRVCQGPPLPPGRTQAFAPAAAGLAWLQRLAADACAATPSSERLLIVLRRLPDLAPVRPLAQPGRVGLALQGHGLRGALRAQGLAAPDEAAGLQSPHCLHIVLAEPLESRRAEQALAERVADASGMRVHTSRLLTPASHLLRDQAGPLAALAQALARALPPLAAALLRSALVLARWRAQRTACQRRLAIHQRERQLQQQLSFAQAAPRPNLPRPSHRSTEIG